MIVLSKYKNKYFIHKDLPINNGAERYYSLYLLKDGTWYSITFSGSSTAYCDTLNEVKELCKKYNVTLDKNTYY